MRSREKGGRRLGGKNSGEKKEEGKKMVSKKMERKRKDDETHWGVGEMRNCTGFTERRKRNEDEWTNKSKEQLSLLSDHVS